MTSFTKKNNRRATVLLTRNLRARPILRTAFETRPAQMEDAVRGFYFDSIDMVREFEGSENPKNFMLAIFSDYGIDALLLKQIIDAYPAPPVLIEFLNTHFKGLFKWHNALQSLDKAMHDDVLDCVVFFKMFNRHFLTVESLKNLVTWHQSTAILSGKPAKLKLDCEQAIIAANCVQNLTVATVKNALVPLYGYAVGLSQTPVYWSDYAEFHAKDLAKIPLLAGNDDAFFSEMWLAYGIDLNQDFNISCVEGNFGMSIDFKIDFVNTSIDFEDADDGSETDIGRLPIVAAYRQIVAYALRGEFEKVRMVYEACDNCEPVEA